ncbi:sensor histidine kinase [Kutzneria viridogrisea]|uniref:Oxygen sensor histidine kinase NreB n=1 Tax=Kutzneria viridogrisea TaxID=47990 RepID=A0ABR6BIT8_9PSEU|nr:signal transduction histidine kinase [Kutzneria viridogrisea]
MDGRERLIFSSSGYVLLAVSSVLAALMPLSEPHGGLPLTAALVLAAALWLLWTVPGKPSRPLLYYVVLVALIVALTWCNAWFALFGSVGFAHAFGLLSTRFVAVGVAVQAVLSAFVQHPDQGTAWLLIVNVGVPLLYAGLVVGHESEKHKRTNAELAAALAENSGLHAQLLAQAREAGVLDERQRMAQEIHDTLAQGLAGIVTQLQAEDQTGDRAHLATAARLARQSLTEARRSVRALRPEPLEGTRLPEAVGALAADWSRTEGVPAQLHTDGEPWPVPAEVEVALYRVAQEALTNIAKHARASRAGLTLSYLEDQVVLDVRDDGVGFSGQPHGDGFGLTVMRQRLDGVGGRLSVESEPGVGTAISASVPGGRGE